MNWEVFWIAASVVVAIVIALVGMFWKLFNLIHKRLSVLEMTAVGKEAIEMILEDRSDQLKKSEKRFDALVQAIAKNNPK